MTKEQIIKVIQRYTPVLVTDEITHAKIADEIMAIDYIAPIKISEIERLENFNKLWAMHSKGNKKTALERFIKVKVPFIELQQILQKYITSNDFQYLKGLDVWLNPAKEHWNDPIVYKNGEPPKDLPKNLEGMIM